MNHHLICVPIDYLQKVEAKKWKESTVDTAHTLPINGPADSHMTEIIIETNVVVMNQDNLEEVIPRRGADIVIVTHINIVITIKIEEVGPGIEALKTKDQSLMSEAIKRSINHIETDPDLWMGNLTFL